MESKSRKPWLSIFGCIAFMTIGCHSNTQPTSENFIKGLNAYYSTHDDCLYTSAPRFPYEVGQGAESKQPRAQMEALTEAGLTKPKDDKGINVTVYTLTPLGEHVGGRMCYGHRAVTSIDSFTPPAKGDSGFLETQVTFHYKVMDVPVWAKTEKMQKAFPDMAKATSGQATGTMKLANAGAGWQVPN